MNPPVRVALVNDHPLVIEGLASLLADAEGIEVVELDTLVPVASPVDILLLDTYASSLPIDETVRGRLSEQSASRLAVYAWQVDDDLVHDSLAAGASGVLSKALTAQELAHALRTIQQGHRVVERGASAVAADLDPDHGVKGRDWPGRNEGLSMRESEMITLICQGLSNEQIAQDLFLSPNSVKSYIRSAYRKIGATSRSQAVIWGLEHGMRPSASRKAS
ncbi:response regulator transcription factor [Luteococcus sp.]|uniref:response regulator transcription factor n=1 Tax=Luteococcus sp. TaxID=1969402 RepID=UPI003734F2EB